MGGLKGLGSLGSLQAVSLGRLGQAMTPQQPGTQPAPWHVDRVAQHRQIRHKAFVDVKATGRGGRCRSEAQPKGLV